MTHLSLGQAVAAKSVMCVPCAHASSGACCVLIVDVTPVARQLGMNVDVLREREVLFSAPCRELTDKVKKIFWLHSYGERGVNRERICTGGPRTIEDEDVSDSTDDKYAPGGALRARLADDHMAPPFSARACCRSPPTQ